MNNIMMDNNILFTTLFVNLKCAMCTFIAS